MSAANRPTSSISPAYVLILEPMLMKRSLCNPGLLHKGSSIAQDRALFDVPEARVVKTERSIPCRGHSVRTERGVEERGGPRRRRQLPIVAVGQAQGNASRGHTMVKTGWPTAR